MLRLGYGGYAFIGEYQVLITSGSFSAEHSPSYMNMLDMPVAEGSGNSSAGNMSRVNHADGVSSYSGSISFDVDSSVIGLFGKYLFRKNQFGATIGDGENNFSMMGCYVTSLSMSATAGGLMTSSISFVGKEGREENIGPIAAYVRDATPLAYWRTGNLDLRDWTLTMSQAVRPMYGNSDSTDIYGNGSVMSSNPKYLKVGAVEYTLDVTSYTPQLTNKIFVKTSSFTIAGKTTSVGYSFGGLDDVGMYTHTFSSVADGASDAVVITVV